MDIHEEVGKLLHLQHAEDLLFLEGNDGRLKLVEYFKNLLQILKGHTKNKYKVSVKYDGSPSLIAGIDPVSKKFFVGTKSVFNKTQPKLSFTKADVDSYYSDSPDLANKLKLALEYLPKLGIQGIVQGDFMFSHDTVKKQTIDGVNYLTFQPNTITYAVEADSQLAAKIRVAKIGIVFHTSYTGSNIQNIKAKFGVNMKGWRHVPGVWYDDANLKDYSGSATFTVKEQEAAKHMIGRLEDVKLIELDPQVKAWLSMHLNQQVRAGTYKLDYNSFVEFVKKLHAEQVAALKTEKGKEARQKAGANWEAVLNKAKPALEHLFDVHAMAYRLKILFLRKLEEIDTLRGFIKTNDGYQTTKPEGFVAIDHLKTGAIKLVNRLVFSAANFAQSKNIMKEEKERVAVLAVGRLNPPTNAHEHLINFVQKYAQRMGGQGFLAVTQTQDSKKNPLSYRDKLYFVGKMTKGKINLINNKDVINPFAAVKYLEEQGFSHIILVGGSDRVPEFKRQFAPYINAKGKEFSINVSKFEVVSAGDRDPDSDDISGMSASKLRELAKVGDYKGFEAGLSTRFTAIDKQSLYDKVRKGLQLKVESVRSWMK